MKPFSITFKLDAKKLAIMYICYKFRFPISFMLAFYEMYQENTLFILKAMSCAKKITLNDNAFIKILEESKLLHKQILTGITTNIKRNKLITQVKSGRLITEMIPDCPEINLKEFTDEYAQFIKYYLIKNVVNLFSEDIELKVDTNDLYVELR